MGKIEEIRAEMMAAMKAKDKVRKDALSALLGALKNEWINKRADLTQEEENSVIAREMKQIKETLEACPPDRTDTIRECESRLAVYKEFAPAELTEEEIRAILDEVLKTLSITSPAAQDKGKIMKELMPRVKGRADGKLVNDLVSRLFS